MDKHMKLLSKPEYLAQIAATRDERMGWWREARFGMFVHIGLYSALGRNEWAMALENWPREAYERLAEKFVVREGAPMEWARLAKASGMKYMVLTTRHHEGFSLWDSKANPFNSVNLGPRRDIVREFVEACRENGLGIGFYSSLMDWHHSDGGAAAYDSEARKRFTDYLYALNCELLTQYGKIDILWYDVPSPMENHEGWNSLEMNQRLRALQPQLIINNRSHLPEDFGTPEEHLAADAKADWEACMTFNGISWGYVPERQALPYSYNAQRILRMLAATTSTGGNLLLNIGPAPDGSIPKEAVAPLRTVGRWLEVHGECAYGRVERSKYDGANGVCTISVKGNDVYLWNWIWPEEGEIVLGGFTSALKSATLLEDGSEIAFSQAGYRIVLTGLPCESPDKIAGVAVIRLRFDEAPGHIRFATTPALTSGQVYR